MTEPNYLVQTADGILHAYFSRQILLIDLAINRGEWAKVFKLKSGIGTIRYVQTNEAEIRNEQEKAS